MSAPVVSIILPTRNRANLLTTAIQGVLAQSFTDWELIVVDDGSTDDTPEVLANFTAQDPRIIPAQGPGKGVAIARNIGIARARGKYVALLDDDDVWFPFKLQRQVETLEAFPDAAFVFTDGSSYDETGESSGSCLPKGNKVFRNWLERSRTSMPDVYAGPFRDVLVAISCVTMSTMMVRKAAIDEAGGFRTECVIGEGYDLWLRISARHPAALLDLKTMKYWISPEGYSGPRNEREFRYHESNAIVLQKQIAGFPRHLKQVAARRIAWGAREAGKYYLSKNNVGRARELFLMSLRYKPWQLKLPFYLAVSYTTRKN